MKKHLIYALICVSFVSFAASFSVFAKEGKIVREAAVAGRFYDADPTVLKNKVNSLLSMETPTMVDSKPIALIAPHAGYMYSGLIAAHGYSNIKDHKYDRVIILAPSHTKRFRGISVPHFTHYKTPLGLVEVDRKVCDKLLKTPKAYKEDKRKWWPFGTMPTAHVQEHSLETQLPFLQMAIKKFKIVPLLVGYLNIEDYALIAKTIKPLITKNTLIVVSTDFMHYGDSYSFVPFRNNVEENIRKYDYTAFKIISQIDFDRFVEYRQATGSTICGTRAISVLLKTLPRTSRGKLIAYDTSGRQAQNFAFSVSYASMAFTIEKKGKAKAKVDDKSKEKNKAKTENKNPENESASTKKEESKPEPQTDKN